MFTRCEVPTPFRIGPVNAYLSGRTVVDPGPASEEAWATLQGALEARELAPGDVERVLITHPHPDHFGLARHLREAGARVLASEPAADIVRDFRGHHEYEKGFFVDFFERQGMAREVAETVTGLPEPYLRFAPDVEVDRALAAGDRLEVRDATLEVDEVEGHAAGELLFAFEHGGERRALVGDNVLGDITPAPLLLPPPEEGAERPRVLPAFNRSLDRLRGEGYDRFLPGHREVIPDPAGRIDEIREAHERRTERVHELVDGPTTAVDVMEGLFGDLPATEQFPGMSEAVGHLDVLEERGRIERTERGGMVIHERT